jgi:hypothetical protein
MSANTENLPTGVSQDSRLSPEEQIFTVQELAECWKVSRDFIHRRFVNEPGVIVLNNSKPGKRPYRTLRIPQSVANRVRNK